MAGRFARCPRHRAGFGFGQLKKLYEAIRFANFDEGDSSASASVAAQQSVAEVAPVSEISIDLDDLLAEPVRDFLPESAAMPEALDAPSGSLRLCRNLRLPRSRFQCLPLQNLCRNRCLLLLPLLYPSRIRRLPSELPLNPCLYRNLYPLCSLFLYRSLRPSRCRCLRRPVFAAGRFDGRAGRQSAGNRARCCGSDRSGGACRIVCRTGGCPLL